MKHIYQTLVIVLVTIAATIAILAIFGLVTWGDASKTALTVAEVAVVVIAAALLIRWAAKLDAKPDQTEFPK